MTVNVADWSETPASNSTVDGINIAEGCPAGNINGGLRAVMAGVKTLKGTIPDVTGYLQKSGGVMTGGLTYTSAGAFLYHAGSAQASGRVFVQAAGGSAPSMSNGDILIEY